LIEVTFITYGGTNNNSGGNDNSNMRRDGDDVNRRSNNGSYAGNCWDAGGLVQTP